MIKKSIPPLIVLLIVLVSPFVASDVGESWVITVDNDVPYLGDSVTFTVRSIHQIGFVILVVYVFNNTGVRIDADLIRMDYQNLVNWTWDTRIDFEPGVYRIEFRFSEEVIGNFQIDLIYDELDFALKRIIQLEEDLEKQHNRVMQVAFDIHDVKESTWAYIVKPGIMAFIVSLINIVLILLVGFKYYGSVIRSLLERGKKISWMGHGFAPQTGGEFPRMGGYEDVNDNVLDMTDEEFMSRCKEYNTRSRRPIRVGKERS